ncbi:hypothetical protein Trydic_g2050 [Trypoxylus dichotomus]
MPTSDLPGELKQQDTTEFPPRGVSPYSVTYYCIVCYTDNTHYSSPFNTFTNTICSFHESRFNIVDISIINVTPKRKRPYSVLDVGVTRSNDFTPKARK